MFFDFFARVSRGYRARMARTEPDKSARIAVTRRIPGAISIPGTRVETLGDERPQREQVLEFVAGARAIVTMFTDRVDAQMLDAAGDGVAVVCNFAVGYDNFDLEACRDRGVRVCNTPDAVTEGTANIAFLLILACARRLIPADRYARSAAYPAEGPLGMTDFMGRDLTGRELLIVGAGRIGFATAMRARSLGMRVSYVARSRHLEFEMSPLGARRVDLDEGLEHADVVSVHTPLSEATRHLISAERIERMKDDAILVNTARGPVIDESALAAALARGKLWGVGLDVYEHEPEVHPGLVGSDRAVLTPHIGSAEQRWREAMTEMVERNIAAVFEGREPPNAVV